MSMTVEFTEERALKLVTLLRSGFEVLELDAVPEDPAGLRKAFAVFPSGVTGICGLAGGEPLGMAASAFTAVSLNPPLLSVCIQNTSTTWPTLRALPRLGVSVFAEDQGQLCMALSAKAGDRFADISWTADPDGGVLINGASAWFNCSVHAEVPAGDHLIALLRIHEMRIHPDREPLVFHQSRFRRLTVEAV